MVDQPDPIGEPRGSLPANEQPPAPSGSFTPGPWVAEESEIFAAAGDAVQIAETVPLADDPQDILGFGRTEFANARLIAAAPELYEAVQRALRHAINIGIDVEDSSYVQQLRAALAKAEGR
jgi:hypothetical protein